jgi:hypothetical protein
MDEIEVNIDDALGSTATALLRFASGVFPHTQKAVYDATIAARDTWREVAGNELKHSTGTYVRSIGISTDIQDPLHGLVISNHPAARYLEQGYGPFDMKPGLLRSQKAKVSKEGHRYMTVPLRHGTPRTGATEAGRGEERATLASMMPTGVAKMAEKLVRSHMKGGPGQKRLPDMGWFLQTKLTPRLLGLPAYTWKHGKFAGLVKTGAPGHTQYMTFRTVSAKKSDPSSWIHPGLRALRICEQAKVECEPTVKEILKRGFEKDLEEIRQQIAGVR